MLRDKIIAPEIGQIWKVPVYDVEWIVTDCQDDGPRPVGQWPPRRTTVVMERRDRPSKIKAIDFRTLYLHYELVE